MRSESRVGRFYGVGVGPGDPELLTLKGARVLRECSVVVVPKKGSHDASYAYSIVRDLIDTGRQELLDLVFPMKKDLDQLVSYWEEAVDEIHRRLIDGKDCVFLTEGDPFFYGTFIYIYRILRERHPEVEMEVVPGVTSLNASAARSCLPLVNGDDRLAVLPATYEGESLRKALQEFDAVVLLKVNSVFDKVLDLLEELGLAEKAVFVKKCTAHDEEIVRDVRSLRGKKLDYLSLLIVRK
ncbi:MAG: precorrin-2 C(20)-methyltransferase [Chloroflexi bacterium]|nr:precorrin-2 C(20)-methyltransferase [Chloroflexota bacterium]MDA8188096.1 precorrin-2 C(20)-methyltransferase [Dehalococcoidales bacterium]